MPAEWRSSPKQITFYPSYSCQLRCRFCLTHTRRLFYHPPDMTRAVAEEVLRAFPGARRVVAAGLGDASCCEELGGVLQAALEANRETWLQSHGLDLVRRDDIPWRKLAGVGVSVNEVTPNAYERSMGASRLEEVVELLAFLRERSVPYWLTYVVDAHNVQWCSAYVAFAGLHGARGASFISRAPFHPERVRGWWGDDCAEELERQRERVRLQRGHPHVTWMRRPPRLDGWKPCAMLRRILFVDGGGAVACCCIGTGTDPALGNVLEQGAAVWTGPGLEAFRAEVEGELQPACRHCNRPVERDTVTS